MFTFISFLIIYYTCSQTQHVYVQGGFKKVPPKVKKPAAKKSSSAIAAAAAAEAKARAAKKGNKKDKSTFNQVGFSVVQRTLACLISQIRRFQTHSV